MTKCIDCGCELSDHDGADRHWEWQDCVTALKARALSAEAELAALKAATEWKPVTDDWPLYNQSLPVLMRIKVIRWGFRANGLWHLTGGKYAADAVTHAFELPAPPQE